ALSDETQTLATPLETLVRRRGKRFPMGRFFELIAEHRPAGMVVGLPLAWLILRQGPGRLRAALGVGAAGLATAGPPLVWRWIELGNPVLPTYNDVFKSDLWPTGERTTYGFPLVDEQGGSPAVDLVVRSATDTIQLHQASPDGAFGLLVGIAALGVVLGWARAGRDRDRDRDRDRGMLVLWGGLLVAAVWWWMQFRYLRFLAPIAALAAIVLAWSPGAARPWGLADRLAPVAVAVAVALFVPSTIAQYWNVPDRELPLDAALRQQDDYDYELASMPEREAVAVFDRLSPPGTLAISEAPQRAWLTGGRDLSPGWEVAERLEAAAAPPPTRPPLERLRGLGVTWVVARQGDKPFNLPFVGPPTRRHSEVLWAGRGWLVAGLTERPREPRPRDPGAIRVERLDTSTAYTVPACPGQLLTVDVRSSGSIDKKIPIEFDLGTPSAAMRIEVFASVAERLFATVPAGARSAKVTVQDVKGTSVRPLRFGALGACG
nr:RuvX/YqgF family protein [Actinomycetota bacterium]